MSESITHMLDKEAKDVLEKHICYVLITCGEPNEAGEMKVEMTYEGDKALASYLIESAQGLLSE